MEKLLISEADLRDVLAVAKEKANLTRMQESYLIYEILRRTVTIDLPGNTPKK